jgi:hypothetical protein
MDRENAIKAVEEVFDYWLEQHRCLHPLALEDVLQLKADALALLKEQEAVVPILRREGRNKYYNDYVCPRCDNEVVYEQNYCSECGVEFMWEGR